MGRQTKIATCPPPSWKCKGGPGGPRSPNLVRQNPGPYSEREVGL